MKTVLLNFYKSILLIAFCFKLCISTAQEKPILLEFGKDQAKAELFFGNKMASSTEEAESLLKIELGRLQKAGYLAISIDEIRETKEAIIAKGFLGEVFNIQFIQIQNQETLLDSSSAPFSYLDYERWVNSRLEKHNERGFPFAKIKLQNWTVGKNGLNFFLEEDKGTAILFDTIKVLDGKMSVNFLSRYLDIKPGQAFNNKRILEIPKRMEELDIMKLSGSPSIKFSPGKAQVLLPVKRVNANRFNLLLGMSPNNEITGRFALTGEADLDLNNLFGSGEKFHFRFEQFERTTKKVNVFFDYPYLPIVPVGLDFELDLFLKDSAFLNRKVSFGVHHLLPDRKWVRLFYESEVSNVFKVDTAKIILNKTLPELLDFSSNHFGVEGRWEQLDYSKNPRKGFAIRNRVAVGRKQIKQNSLVTGLNDPLNPGFDFDELYDSFSSPIISSKAELLVSGFIPIAKQSAVKIKVDAGLIESKRLGANEMFRLGGQQRLRGFDEEVFSSSLFAIGGLEYRFLSWSGPNSAMYAFGEYGYFERAEENFKNPSRTISAGLGLDLDTKAGIFGISYALGKRNNDPLEFRNGKIHFGYLNYF